MCRQDRRRTQRGPLVDAHVLRAWFLDASARRDDRTAGPNVNANAACGFWFHRREHAREDRKFHLMLPEFSAMHVCQNLPTTLLFRHDHDEHFLAGLAQGFRR